MKAHLLVLATSLCLTAAFATPVSAASTTTDTHTAKATEAPTIACNLKGCWTVHKKAQQEREAQRSSTSNSGQHPVAQPHP